jgi:excisionase family DNA binding protein
MATARLAGVHAEEDDTPTTAAAELGISRTHLRHLMDSGLIAFHMVGSHHRITRAEVERVRALWKHRGKGLAAMDAASEGIDT